MPNVLRRGLSAWNCTHLTAQENYIASYCPQQQHITVLTITRSAGHGYRIDSWENLDCYFSEKSIFSSVEFEFQNDFLFGVKNHPTNAWVSKRVPSPNGKKNKIITKNEDRISNSGWYEAPSLSLGWKSYLRSPLNFASLFRFSENSPLRTWEFVEWFSLPSKNRFEISTRGRKYRFFWRTTDSIENICFPTRNRVQRCCIVCSH